MHAWRCLQMNLQIIKSVDGKAEYVLLPIHVYHALRDQINHKLVDKKNMDDYIPFDPTRYVANPVALARIKACITQQELAKRMNVTQAYISKLEKQNKISPKTLHKIKMALRKKMRKR